jgi:methenyltetrahydrofolate cyclohydrolase
VNFYEFCEKLGSVSPSPGGGAAAALSLSLSASCIEKSIRFSIKEENDFINESIKIRKTGFELSEKDQYAFKNWSDSKKLPKATDEEKKIRNEKMNFYLEQCVNVPYDICKNSYELLNLTEKFLPLCNKFLISDVAVGMSLNFSAFESGIFNIQANFPYLKNEVLKKELTDYIKDNRENFLIRKNSINNKCEDILTK